MCGIIGCSSSDNINRDDVKLGMLMADDRGGHSTGFTDNDIILRSTGDVRGFFTKDEESPIQIPDEFNKFISHTRYATKGKKTLGNAHPFNFDNALGVHNGTIENFDELNEEYGEEALGILKEKFSDKEYIQSMEEVESDSLLTYFLISKFGLRKTTKMLKGSMALCYFDNAGRINIYRYDKPLCYGFKGNELWFGTLKKYLKALGCRNIKPFTQHAHYIIEGGNVKESQQLKNDELPYKKDSTRKDLDPDIDEEKQLKGVTVKRKKKEEKKSSDGGSEKKSTNEGEFKAPAYAKCELSKHDERLLLWWFATSIHGMLYIEKAGMEDVLSYDLTAEEERALFNDDFPELKDAVYEELEHIELAEELKSTHKENVAHAK